MTQEHAALESLVRKRVRALRLAHGWSLDDLARRAALSPSTLSRIESGARRLALDQLVVLAQALDTTLDQLVASDAPDVVVSPVVDGHGWRRWPVRGQPGLSVVRQRLTTPPDPARMRAHAGQEWLVVLSGTALLLLGERRYRLEPDQAAEFPTMLPHAIGAEREPVDVLAIFDRDAGRDHRGPLAGSRGPAG